MLLMKDFYSFDVITKKRAHNSDAHKQIILLAIHVIPVWKLYMFSHISFGAHFLRKRGASGRTGRIGVPHWAHRDRGASGRNKTGSGRARRHSGATSDSSNRGRATETGQWQRRRCNGRGSTTAAAVVAVQWQWGDGAVVGWRGALFLPGAQSAPGKNM